jgi:succinate dehydrogenase / fumarate reductase membrane anchor subunit
LTLALLHGANGLRIVIDDYIPDDRMRTLLVWTVATLVLIFFMLGTITLITFPSAPGGNLGPHCLR